MQAMTAIAKILLLRLAGFFSTSGNKYGALKQQNGLLERSSFSRSIMILSLQLNWKATHIILGLSISMVGHHSCPR
ncbi:hypothetical protein B0H34DRAFT_685865 [Crassisporium funariophilum]|nr:hypothetical protein B0H34DRAFT_685865 [Crassisporium funariophilum]